MSSALPIRVPPALSARAAEFLDALSFFTRIPVRRAGPFAFERFAWAAPLAGAVVGMIAAAAGGAANLLALPPGLRAVVAIAAGVLATGAMHEDGFADCADGFGGGRAKDDKLAIMRDSRLGTYGVVALCLGLIAKFSMLSVLFRAGFGPAAAALVISAGAGRLASLAPLALLGPARGEGAGAAAGRLPMGALGAAALTLAALAAVAGLFALGVMVALFACVVAAAAAYGFAMLARRQIGGQTGDVAGAAAFAGELAALAALLVDWRGV